MFFLLLLAASLTSFLLVFSSVLGGHPVLSDVTAVPLLSLRCSMVYPLLFNLFVALQAGYQENPIEAAVPHLRLISHFIFPEGVD